MNTDRFKDAVYKRTVLKGNYKEVIVLLEKEINWRKKYNELFETDETHTFWIDSMQSLVQKLKTKYKSTDRYRKDMGKEKENVTATTSYVPPHMRRRQQMMQ